MKQTLKKTGRFLAQGILTLAALFILLLAVIQIVLMGAVLLLNTEPGQKEIRNQLAALLAESPYNAGFDRVYYDPVRGLTVYGLSVSDAQGLILESDSVSVSVALSKISARILDLSLTAGNTVLYKLPPAGETPETPDNEGLSPFAMPDLYFTSVNIPVLKIARLELKEDVAGTALVLAPSLRAGVTLGDSIDASLSLNPNASASLAGVSLPDELLIDGAFTPASLEFALRQLSVTSPDYVLKAKADGGLSDGAAVAAELSLSYHELSVPSGGAFSSATLNALVGGTISSPSVNADGKLITASLKERGLDDIAFGVSSAVNTGIADVTVGTAYSGQPVSLKAQISQEDDTVNLLSLTADAPYLTLEGKGTLSKTTMLFDGELNAKLSDLSHYAALAGVKLAGAADISVSLAAKDNAQSVNATASAANLVYDANKLKKLDAKAYIADISVPWPQSADITASGLSAGDAATLSLLTAAIREDAPEQYRLTIDGRGDLGGPVSFSGKAGVVDIRETLPTVSGLDLTVRLRNSPFRLSGGLDRNHLDLALDIDGISPADLAGTLPEGLRQTRLNGKATMTGTPAAPVTKADFSLTGLEAGPMKGIALTANAVHENGQVRAEITGRGPGIRNLQADAGFALPFSLVPFSLDYSDAAPLSGKLLADLDMGAISPLFLPPTMQADGTLDANATLSGTLGKPGFAGKAVLKGGSFTDSENGIRIAAIEAAADITPERLALRTLRATDGERGKLNGQGNISFAGGGSDLSITMRDFHLPNSDLADGYIGADIGVRDSGTAYTAGGTIDIREMNITIPETFQSRIPELNIIERKDKTDTSAAKALQLSLSIRAPNQVFVRGWGLDAEFGGSLDISGAADAPEINGTFSAKRGRYEEFGKRFKLERANLRFQGAVPPSPYLDIEATTPAEDVTASILLTGPVKTPAIAFSSSPGLPEDEVLSRILFGRDTTKITPFQAVQLAQTLQRFSGRGGPGFDPLGTLRSATGLDDIKIDTDENGDTNVGVGKYLTDKVYLEVERGKAENSGAANIQIELTPSVNIQSEIGQDAQTGGGIFWKRDY